MVKLLLFFNLIFIIKTRLNVGAVHYSLFTRPNEFIIFSLGLVHYNQ